MKRWLLLLILLLAAHQFFGAGFSLWTQRPAAAMAPGAIAPKAPQQAPPRSREPIQRGRFTITPVQSFAINARVLGRENYRWDTEAELSPMDLALGWGPMSDSAVTRHIRIRQSQRWYHWHTDDAPIPLPDIARHSANMHMIPATDEVAQQLRRVREGDHVLLRGHLVNVRRDDGWRWRSSLSRDDTGAGACELVWVEELRIEPH